MVVDEHLVLCASRRKLLEEARDLSVAAVHEVDLEALRAELREVFCDLLLLAVDLSPRHPEDDADALLVSVVDEVGNINVLVELPDVERLAPTLVEDHVLDAVLRGEVDEALVSLRVAPSAVVKVVPPVPRDLAGLHPGEVGALRGRRRESVEDVSLAKLGRRVGERKGAPGERTRRIGLGDEVLGILDLHPAAALLEPGFLAPSADALGRLRILGKERLERRAALGLLDVAEVPDRIVMEAGINDRDGLAIDPGGVDERKIGHLAGIGLEIGRVGKLGDRLLTAERIAARAVKPAANALGERHVGLLAVDDARLLRLETVGNAVVARGETNAKVAKVNEELFPGEIELALLVDRRRRKTAELRRTHGAGLRDAFLDALAVHLEPDLGLGDNDNSITHDLVGEGIGIEANLVLPVGRNGRVHIGIERRRG